MEALGLIENRSYLSSVVAADIALKAADVTLIDMEIIKGGYVTVKFIGDVAAVKAAVEAGTVAVESFQTLISSHVIPRIHSETHQLIKFPDRQEDIPGLSPETEPIEEAPREQMEEVERDEENERPEQNDTAIAAVEPEEQKVVNMVEKKEEREIKQDREPERVKKAKELTREELEQLTVGKLRQLVRAHDAMANNTKNIKYARKAELISSLLELEQDDSPDDKLDG